MPAWLCHPAAAVVAATVRGHPHPAQALPAPLCAPVHVLCALSLSRPCPACPTWTLLLPSISAPGAVRQELGLTPAPCFLEQPRASISHSHSAWQDPALTALKCVVATVASLGEV